MTPFTGELLPALIGSLPMTDHGEATRLMLKYAPEIPLWVQLPAHKEEGMIAQFIEGLPGVVQRAGKIRIDPTGPNFEEERLLFYDDYLAVTEGEVDLTNSRFALSEKSARGFFELMSQAETLSKPPRAIKGQITGPVTLGTSLLTQEGRAVFYDLDLRDAVTKLLAMKAKWQVRMLKKLGVPVILFFDEPALAGYGSSAFLSITREDIAICFDEVIGAVLDEGGLTGVHVCANTDWSLILDSRADIVSFDAFSYADNFILYPKQIRAFMERGGILAWGIVPTSAEDLKNVTVDSLMSKLSDDFKKIEKIGVPPEQVLHQSLITPSCGTGSLRLEEALKVLEFTQEISKRFRETSTK